MKKFNPKVDQYILNAKPFAQPILEHLRGIVHHYCPETEEKIKWGMPFFDYKGAMMCHMASFKEHCAFGFWKANLLKDPKNLLNNTTQNGMGQFGKIKTLTDIPAEKQMGLWIKQAMELNEKGIINKKPKPNKAKELLEIPALLKKQLAKNQLALQHFQKLSISCKNEYIVWINTAKREETVLKRVYTTLQWLEEGKSLNWKYENKR